MKLCGDGGGHLRGLPAGFQCGAQGVLRDTGREVLGAARGRESENERKFEKRPSDASASAGCTRALLGLKLVACLGLGVLWPQMAPSVPKQATRTLLMACFAWSLSLWSGRKILSSSAPSVMIRVRSACILLFSLPAERA